MLIFRSVQIPKKLFGSVLAIGNFDGVHLGHQSVLLNAKRIAVESQSKVGVLTFEPHPKCYFKKNYEYFRLTPFRTKIDIFKSLGIEFVVNLAFNKNLSKISADDFLRIFLVENLKVSHVVTGFDFVFGNKQSGNVNFIRKFSKDFKKFKFTEVSELNLNNHEISSSHIRNLLRNGYIDEANSILSRHWTIVSRVIKGEQKAREIGFKTANLKINKYCNLCHGVYSVSIFFEKNNKEYFGIANYGIKPTFNKVDPLLEIHIFNFDREIYGKKIKVSFKRFIRREKKFESIQKLKEQIQEDINFVKTNND
tara:strand:- start:13 stop:939 length:927 start_codon:yes stop_codon:yes gene_type:complete